MWETWSVVERYAMVLPFAVVVMIGVVPSRRQPDSPFVSRQRWGSRELVIVFGVITVIDLAPPPAISTLSGAWLEAIVNGVRALLVIASVWGVVRWRHSHPWQALGFEPATALSHALWSLRIGLGILSAFAILVVLLQLNASGMDPARSASGRAGWDARLGAVVAGGIVTAVLGPLAEELVFRGLAYGPLFRKFGAAGAAIGSAAVWALGHYSGLSPTGVFKMVFILALGIVYAEIYRRRESLVPTVVFHVVTNAPFVLMREHSMAVLVPVAVVLVALWITTAVWFHVVDRRGLRATAPPPRS
jgi:membrane protease YdiL (CAAX protease family)